MIGRALTWAHGILDRIEEAVTIDRVCSEERPWSMRDMSVFDPRRPVCCVWCNTKHCAVHCVWCGVDQSNGGGIMFSVAGPGVGHAADCPELLGVYPVHPSEEIECCGCDQLIVGYYSHRATGTDDAFGVGLAGEWVDIVCLGCLVPQVSP